MHSYSKVLVLFMCTILHRTNGLKCKCEANLPTAENTCNDDGTCEVTVGTCAIVQQLSFTQKACANENSYGCIKQVVDGISSFRCTCKDRDYCNNGVTETDFGTRPNETIKCKCSEGADGCDSTGTCSTTGSCLLIAQSGYEQRQCSEPGQLFLGCLKTDFPGGAARQCGCENSDFCNESIGE